MPDHLRILALISVVIALAAPARAYEANVGDRANNLEGYDAVSQQTVRLDDYFGRWVLVDFWATWCGPCRRELPNLLKQTKPYMDSGELVLLTVSLDKPETLAKLKQVIRENGIKYPVLYDGGGFHSIAAEEWHVDGVPATFLIDPQGVIVANQVRGENLGRMLEYYLRGNPPRCGLSVAHTINADGTLSVFANVMNGGREPVDVRLSYRVKKFIWDADDPTCHVTHGEIIKVEPQSARVTFGEFSETTWEFIVQPAADWHSFNYYVKLLLPGTGTPENGDADAFQILSGSPQLLFIPLRWDDGYFYVPPPDDQLRVYEVAHD